MKIDSNINIMKGTSQMQYVYKGSTLVWEKDHAPEWPYPFFKPYVGHPGRGISIFFDSNINSGQRLNWKWKSDDAEGEGGNYYLTVEDDYKVFLSRDFESLTAYCILNENFSKGWFHFMTNYGMWFKDFGNLSDFNPKGVILNTYYSYGSTEFIFKEKYDYQDERLWPGWLSSFQNIEFFGVDNAWGVNVNEFLSSMPNLKYFYVDENAENYDVENFRYERRFDLTNSTSWTSSSMQFTEWYSPYTTFIVNDNQYWRSIIDWDIANKRNVIFEDTNGNIMHQ